MTRPGRRRVAFRAESAATPRPDGRRHGPRRSARETPPRSARAGSRAGPRIPSRLRRSRAAPWPTPPASPGRSRRRAARLSTFRNPKSRSETTMPSTGSAGCVAQSPSRPTRLPAQVRAFQIAGARRSALPIGSRSPEPGAKRLKSRMPCSTGETPVSIDVHSSGDSAGVSDSSSPQADGGTEPREVRHRPLCQERLELLPVGAVETDEEDRRLASARPASSPTVRGAWENSAAPGRGAARRCGVSPQASRTSPAARSKVMEARERIGRR